MTAYSTQPRGNDGRFGEKLEVGMARRLTETLRAALGHDGIDTPPEPSPELPPDREPEPDLVEPTLAELDARFAAQSAADLRTVDGSDATSLAGYAVAVEAPTIGEAAVMALTGKAHPAVVTEALTFLEVKDWDPKLHPRDKDGQFISIGAILNLLGSVGGGRGTVVGNGPDNHVTIRKEDGTTVDVPANQTYAASDLAEVPKVGKPGTFGTPGTPGDFADNAPDAPKKPAAKKPDAKPDGILPPDLPDDANGLYRALQSNKPVGNDPNRSALNLTAGAIGATGDGREAGSALANRANDAQTNDRILANLDAVEKVADELDAAGITVNTAGGTKLSDYLRDYSAGFRETHSGRQNATDAATADAATPDAPNPDMPGQEPLVAANVAPGYDFNKEGEYARARDDARTRLDAELTDDAAVVAAIDANQAAYDEFPKGPQTGEISDARNVNMAEGDALYQIAEERGLMKRDDRGMLVDTPKMEQARRDPAATEVDPRLLKAGETFSLPADDKWNRPPGPYTVAADARPDYGDPELAVVPVVGPDGRQVRMIVDASKPVSTGEQPTDVVSPNVQPDSGIVSPNTVEVPEFVTRNLAKIESAGRTAPPATGTVDDPIDVQGDLDEAVRLLAEGKHVRLNQPDEVATLLAKLRDAVNQALESGEEAPNVDLCQVTVPGTNLFCHESKGIPRAQMPQLSGKAVPGSPAAEKANDKGEANIEAEFRVALADRGVSITPATVRADHLRATQSELDGPKVAGMSKAMSEGKVKDAPIFVTRDGYIIDGHHRWASKVALDTADNELGDVEMPVEVLDMDIGEAIDFANQFALDMGIQPKSLGAAAEGVPTHVVRHLGYISKEGTPDGSGTVTDPIDVQGDIDRALQLLSEGKHIRLNQPDEVASLLDRVNQMVAEAKKMGDRAPMYDLCLVSVPGTNLFCAEHQGIDRIDMPQLEGSPIEGTPAWDMPRNEFDGNVNVMEAFVAALDEIGVSTTDTTMPASHLRASQRELEGAKVAGIATAMEEGGKPWLETPIFVTRDGYVIDGHHRWAAKVGIDTKDGELGDVPMDVRVVDLDVGAALDFANAFTRRIGIAPQSADTVGLEGTTGGKATPTVADPDVPDVDLPEKPQKPDPGVFYTTPVSEANPEMVAEARAPAADLHNRAVEVEPVVTEILQRLALENGGRMEGLEYRLKGVTGVRDKIVRKRKARKTTTEQESAKINDALRYTAIIAPDTYTETIQAMFGELADLGYEPTEITNTWPRGDDYSGVNATLRAPNGTLIELQFHTDDSFFTKSDIHKDYDIARDEDADLADREAAYQRMAARWDDVEQPKGWETLGEIKYNPSPVVKANVVPTDTPDAEQQIMDQAGVSRATAQEIVKLQGQIEAGNLSATQMAAIYQQLASLLERGNPA